MTCLVQTVPSSVDFAWATKFVLIWNTLQAFELSGLSQWEGA